MSKSAILLSGGMDSIALCFRENPDIAFTIDYGQKPAKSEIYSASKIVEAMNIEHVVLKIDCSSLGVGDLANREQLSLSPSKEWWPFRNQLLITLASMRAIKMGVTRLIIGSVKTDSFHKDGKSEFYRIITELTQFQEGGISVDAPALEFTTAELVKWSGVPLSMLLWAHSCHTSNIPCLKCRGCQKYLLTLQELGIESK